MGQRALRSKRVNLNIFLKKYKTAIFIHGCSWHQHKNCKRAFLPKSNQDYWHKKLARNVERDQRVLMELQSMGLNVITIWECEVRDILQTPKRLFNKIKLSDHSV